MQPVRGNLLTPDQPPQTPQGWEHWFLWVTEKAVAASSPPIAAARPLARGRYLSAEPDLTTTGLVGGDRLPAAAWSVQGTAAGAVVSAAWAAWVAAVPAAVIGSVLCRARLSTNAPSKSAMAEMASSAAAA